MKRNYLILGLLSLTLAACGGGENGIDGKDGKDGASCTITNNEDGTATITCPDGSSFTVKNGEDGKKGDAGSDGEKGQNGESCKLVENSDGSAAVVCPYDGTSYIVRGNTDNFANYCAPGFYGKNCENECRECGEHGDCNDGATGDGSCICEKGYYGDNCVDCTKGVEGSYFGKEECTYTDTRDNNSEVIYPVVKIGDQLWMAENLKARKDINGNNVNCDANTDETRDGITDFVDKYGCLYTWENAMLACPSGWRLPTAEEYLKLIGGTKKLEKYDTTDIQSTSWNSSASNSTGFSALPAGYYFLGNYDNFGDFGYFSSSTELTSSRAFYLSLGRDNADVNYDDNIFGFSVRCLKD